MKIIKKIIIVLFVLVAITLVIALFVKKDYAVVRSIEINKPRTEIFAYTKYLKNQANFSKWAAMDPAMEKTYRGTDGEVGFVSAWKSKVKDVGAGEQEILKITENERLDFELRFLEPFEAKEAAYMTFDSLEENQTKVSWGFNGHMDYPMNIFLLFMDFDKMIGADLETGLKNLKTVMEK